MSGSQFGLADPSQTVCVPMDDQVKSCCAVFYELPLIQALLGDQWHPGGPSLTRKLAGAVLIERNSRVLDIASGTGESARVIAQHF